MKTDALKSGIKETFICLAGLAYLSFFELGQVFESVKEPLILVVTGVIDFIG